MAVTPTEEFAFRLASKQEWINLVRSQPDDFISEYDADMNFTLNPKGFLFAVDRQTGNVAGNISIFKNNNSPFAFVNAFNVVSEYQKGGFIKQMWNAAISCAENKNLVIDLDSKQALTSKFAKSLQDTGVRIRRYSGYLDFENFVHPHRMGQGLHVVHAQAVRLQEIVEFDQKIVGFDRREFLRMLIDHSNRKRYPSKPGSVSLIASCDSGEIVGFGSIRPGSKWAKLGPFYATNEKAARLLLRALVGTISTDLRNSGLEALVLSKHASEGQLLKEIGLKPTGQECVRLCSNENFSTIDYSAIYATANSDVQFV